MSATRSSKWQCSILKVPFYMASADRITQSQRLFSSRASETILHPVFRRFVLNYLVLLRGVVKLDTERALPPQPGSWTPETLNLAGLPDARWREIFILIAMRARSRKPILTDLSVSSPA
jgi:hypothetical protein